VGGSRFFIVDGKIHDILDYAVRTCPKCGYPYMKPHKVNLITKLLIDPMPLFYCPKCGYGEAEERFKK